MNRALLLFGFMNMLKYQLRIVIILVLLLSARFLNAATYISVTGATNWTSTTSWATLKTGTISSNTGSATITGVGTNFTASAPNGSKIYNSAGQLIGTVQSSTATTITLTANALITLGAGSSFYVTAATAPTSTDAVTVTAGNGLTLDTNFTIGNALYTFNANVTDNGTHTLTAITTGGTLIVANNSTTTIAGAVSWDNSTITVNSGSTLITGPLTINNQTQISIAGNLIVNGNVQDDNNGSGTFVVSGYVYINGNYATSVGGVAVSGAGSFDTAGSITTTGGSTVFGSTNDCNGPGCSGTALSCAKIFSVSPSSQALCSGNTASQAITFSTNEAGVTITKWQSTTNFVTFTDIASTSFTLPTQTVTVDTWFRAIFNSPSCGALKSAAAFVDVNSTTPPTTATNTSTQTICNGNTATLSGNTPLVGTGAWSVVSGPSTSTAQFSSITNPTGTFTPAAGAGSYVVRWTISTCSSSFVNATITVSSSNTSTLTSAGGTNAQTVCINTAITPITYATTGATGATVTNLPTGVSGSWAANVVTISGTPTVVGAALTYTVTLTGGCGTITTTGTIAVTANNTLSLTSAGGTNAQTVCINTAITPITYSTTGATGATVTNLPTGVSGSWAANVVTISGTPTVAGAALTYTVTLTGGCGTITTTGAIAVTANNALSLTSAGGTNAQTVCINTAITPITYSTTGATGATVTNLPTGVSGSWAANVVTISGTPTVAGAALTYTVTLTGGCGTITTTGTIAVTANNTLSLTSAAGTNAQTVCINTAITPITYSTTGATGATVTNLPSGVSGSWASNVVTISGTPTVAGAALTYTVTLTGGCGSVNATGTITVSGTPSTSNAGSTQNICLSSGTSLAANTPVTGTGVWTILSGPNTSTSQLNSTVSPSAVFTATAVGTYVLTWTISNSPCTASSSNVTINVYSPTVALWTGRTNSNMSIGTNYVCASTVLSSAVDLIIPAGLSSYPMISTGQTLAVKSITIENGASITINSGGTLNVNGNLTNDGAFNLAGILSFPSSGTFAYDADGGSGSGAFTIISTSATQSGIIGTMSPNATFVGNVSVQRAMGSVGGEQFRYVASPVVNATKPANLGTLYKYNAGWAKYYGNMGIGEGYAASTSQVNWAVTGNIHHGDLSWTGLPVGWNLLGNPYPSDIGWKVAGWLSTNIDPTVAVTDNSISGYPNYFHYFLNTSPKTIAMGQAFWVYVTGGSGSLTITESAKSATNAGTFYREGTKEAKTNFDQSFMISMSNGKNSDQSFLLNPSKESGKNIRPDYTKLFNPEMNIYFIDGNERGMLTYTLEDLHDDIKIPIGIQVTKPGEYEISFRNTEAFGHSLYLVDQQEGQVVPVSASQPYKLTINNADKANDDRFYLSIRPEEIWNAEITVSIFPNPVKDNKVNVEVLGAKQHSAMALMDVNGKVLFTTEVIGINTIDMMNYPAGMYILKVKTDQGVVTRKIMKQ